MCCDWENGDVRVIGVFLNGDELVFEMKCGELVCDESFLLFFNVYYEEIVFCLFVCCFGMCWEVELVIGCVDGDWLMFGVDVIVELRLVVFFWCG